MRLTAWSLGRCGRYISIAWTLQQAYEAFSFFFFFVSLRFNVKNRHKFWVTDLSVDLSDPLYFSALHLLSVDLCYPLCFVALHLLSVDLSYPLSFLALDLFFWRLDFYLFMPRFAASERNGRIDLALRLGGLEQFRAAHHRRRVRVKSRLLRLPGCD